MELKSLKINSNNALLSVMGAIIDKNRQKSYARQLCCTLVSSYSTKINFFNISSLVCGVWNSCEFYVEWHTHNGLYFRLLFWGNHWNTRAKWSPIAPESSECHWSAWLSYNGMQCRYVVSKIKQCIEINPRNITPCTGQNVASDETCALAVAAAIKFHRSHKDQNSKVETAQFT